MSASRSNGILVVGECLVDLAPSPAPGPAGDGSYFRALPGGGPANVAVGLARLGVRTLFAGRLARAGFGPWLRRHLSTNSVDLSLSVDATEDATLAVVTLDPEGRASYIFYGPGTADWQWEESELPDAHTASPGGLGIAAVHTGSIVTAFEPSATVLSRWLAKLYREGQVVVSFDPNVRPSLVADLPAYRRKIEEYVPSAHIVRASDEDVEALYPGADLADAADRWLAAGVHLVVITEGGNGATAFHRNGARARQVPPAVQVADTIGAGDSFSAALLTNLAHQGLLAPHLVATATEAQLQAAVDEAVTASAFTCTRPGADPPTADELGAFMRLTHPAPGQS